VAEREEVSTFSPLSFSEKKAAESPALRDAALLYFMARQNASEIWESMPSAELCYHKVEFGFIK
jgi:hypothetical protein